MNEEKSLYLQMSERLQSTNDQHEIAQIVSDTFRGLFPRCLPFVEKYAQEDIPIVTGVFDAITKCMIAHMSYAQKCMLEMVLGSVSVTASRATDSEGIYRTLFHTDTPDEFENATREVLRDFSQEYYSELNNFATEDWTMIIGIIKCLYLAFEAKMSKEEQLLKQRVFAKAYDIAANQWGW